ncbi:MAG: iron-sulfur cluster assembly accessory protein [Chlamydiae bacterium]|nr:iron-sulfur cluster assembly accessory protein [Chlamydiota bacterium]
MAKVNNKQKQISREMTIEEIFSLFPQKAQKLAQEITDAGLHCVGCQASTWETLEAGMLGHGFSDKEVDQLVEKLNELLLEEANANAIHLTKRAAEKYKQILKEEGKEGWGLRFGDQAAGCSGFEYVLDYSKEAKKDDRIFTSQGIEIHVNEKVVSRLVGSEIDYTDSLKNPGFKISNPNVKGSCGCGKSQNY